MLYFKPPRSAGSAAEGAGAGAFVSVAPFVITLAPNTSFITIEGVRLEHSRSTAVAQPAGRTDPNFWPSNPAALAAAGSIRNITFSNVVVANTGGGGLFLDRCSGCAVLDSEVYGVGTTAIQISGGGHRTLRRSDNLVQNCSIHHFARCKPRHDIVASGLHSSTSASNIVAGRDTHLRAGPEVAGRRQHLPREQSLGGAAPGCARRRQ